MDVTFEVGGREYVVPERQATILAENLRILAKSNPRVSSQATHPAGDDDWRETATELADSIEETLVQRLLEPLRLEGTSADATHRVLRLMVRLENNGAPGLRDSLGEPVERRHGKPRTRGSHIVADPAPQLTRPELLELLVILFVLAVITVIAGVGWTGSWWVLAPVIAALLGVRVATTRATGRLAWSVASVLWWGVFLIPAAVLVTLVGLLIVAIIS